MIEWLHGTVIVPAGSLMLLAVGCVVLTFARRLPWQCVGYMACAVSVAWAVTCAR